VCHQTVSLIARHLEAHGIPTVCLGSAFDILQAGRPPRAVFLDYPLGHSGGCPFDRADQACVLRDALQAFESLRAPGQILTLANRWGEDSWVAEASSTDARDTRQARDTTPQFQHEADREAARLVGAWP
jgi:hypothetical protein